MRKFKGRQNRTVLLAWLVSNVGGEETGVLNYFSAVCQSS